MEECGKFANQSAWHSKSSILGGVISECAAVLFCPLNLLCDSQFTGTQKRTANFEFFVNCCLLCPEWLKNPVKHDKIIPTRKHAQALDTPEELPTSDTTRG